ncbi:MAG: cold shock domain-containing protein [Litoreibacter sp.]
MEGSFHDIIGSAELTGRVRWYCPLKGYGFAAEEITGEDVLIHRNTILSFGRSSIIEGTELRFSATRTLKGMQVVEILEWKTPDGEICKANTKENTGTYVPARVKWFDQDKGYGFLNEFGSSDDVFIFAETLHTSGFASLSSGEAVSMQIGMNEKGKFVSLLRPW